MLFPRITLKNHHNAECWITFSKDAQWFLGMPNGWWSWMPNGLLSVYFTLSYTMEIVNIINILFEMMDNNHQYNSIHLQLSVCDNGQLKVQQNYSSVASHCSKYISAGLNFCWEQWELSKIVLSELALYSKTAFFYLCQCGSHYRVTDSEKTATVLPEKWH